MSDVSKQPIQLSKRAGKARAMLYRMDARAGAVTRIDQVARAKIRHRVRSQVHTNVLGGAERERLQRQVFEYDFAIDPLGANLDEFRVPHRGSVNPSPLGDGKVGRL